jgi:hypothetical protein
VVAIALAPSNARFSAVGADVGVGVGDTNDAAFVDVVTLSTAPERAVDCDSEAESAAAVAVANAASVNTAFGSGPSAVRGPKGPAEFMETADWLMESPGFFADRRVRSATVEDAAAGSWRSDWVIEVTARESDNASAARVGGKDEAVEPAFAASISIAANIESRPARASAAKTTVDSAAFSPSDASPIAALITNRFDDSDGGGNPPASEFEDAAAEDVELEAGVFERVWDVLVSTAYNCGGGTLVTSAAVNPNPAMLVENPAFIDDGSAFADDVFR